MLKKIIFPFLLIPSFLLGQSNYKAGAIVGLNGDTVRGYIDYKDWLNNPASVLFTTQNDVKPRQLSAADILFFEIKGAVSYSSYKVRISQNSNLLEQLNISPDTTTKINTVFLKILQRGDRVTLYEYEDDLKTRYYIKDKQDKVPQELVYTKYMSPENKNTVLFHKGYIGQFMILASRYNLDLSTDISDAQYEQTDLMKIAAKINGTALSTTNDGAKSFRLFAGLGICRESLVYNNTSITNGVNSPSSSISPIPSFGIDIYLNPNVGRLVIRGALSASVFSFNTTETVFNIQTLDYETTPPERFTQYQLSLAPEVIYNLYNTNPLKIYIAAGAKLNYAKYTTNNYVVAVNGATLNSQIYPYFDKVYENFPFSIGAVLNRKIDLNFTWSPPATVTGNNAASEKISSLQAGVNYFFGR